MSVDTKSDIRNKLAVALHYDKTGAPRVVAKGKGVIGARIVELAREHDIPIEENEVLAGALSHVEIGDEIPPELYKAVAEVLDLRAAAVGADPLIARAFRASGRPACAGNTGQTKGPLVIVFPRCHQHRLGLPQSARIPT